MPTYTAPVEDMMFLFEKLRNNKEYNELEKYKEVTPDLVKDILQEAAKINQNLILPLAKVGDENPAILENGVVRTPPGYKEAYKKYIEDGWTSLSCDPKYGGQGMPKTVSAFFDEMLSSASLSFKLYSELSIGAYNCINHHASDEIKNKYLPKIVEGKWSGTMCLTEPVCGTDLGLLKTKAKKQSDGTFKLTGQKIFITSGDHDLTENIIHLVLARVDDSPAGTKGISLFLVPKFIVKEDGNVGPRNGISTGSIETKMGIKGSATCVLNFDEATGYMIGDKEKGLSAMFTMMNLERIVVGIQGLGISEIAYQNSLSYAKERKQGKSNNSKSKNGADFIIEHADIRRSLLNMKSIEEIMYLRSAVESSAQSLGFLPGSADEKLKFYNLPFLDKLEELLLETKAEKLELENRISMFPVNFARGMNWKDKCVILDEAQNSTIKEITTVLTRLGKNSRCFILADPMQTDLKDGRMAGGYEALRKTFSDEESLQFGIYTFEFSEEDIMRSELVKFIINKLKPMEDDKDE